tara:strand:- start:189689 stop:190366 length:678 start_codon:yes stop_codon:yes gene_type:complete
MLDMKRQIKNAIYEQIARATKALSSPKRIEILDLLSQGEKSVEKLAEEADLGIKNASAQLKELKAAHLVESRRDGKYVYYFIPNKEIIDFVYKLRLFSENNFNEIQKITSEIFNESLLFEIQNRKQLLAKAKAGDLILLDVRPIDEYNTSHIPYSISVPLSLLNTELRQFSKKTEIVAYCRGPYCFFAKEAVELLRKKGFKASFIKDGVHEWASHGLPLEAKKVV